MVQLLVKAGADVDSQDNRKVSCLMSAFRKGHVKVVKWLVKHVSQFPSDQDCMRFIATITDKVSDALTLMSFGESFILISLGEGEHVHNPHACRIYLEDTN